MNKILKNKIHYVSCNANLKSLGSLAVPVISSDFIADHIMGIKTKIEGGREGVGEGIFIYMLLHIRVY